MADTWTIDELKALTNEVQTEDLEFKGKSLAIQWCELTESEEPKMAIPDDNLPEEDKTKLYTQIGSAKVIAMIEKGNELNPEGTTIDKESWALLPSTLRYNISNVVLGAGESKQDF